MAQGKRPARGASQWSPVALLPCRGGYEIFDPAAGTREKVNESTAADLDSFAQMLYRPLPEDLSARGLLRYVLRSRRRDLRTMALAGAGAAVLAMAAPQGLAILMNQAIPDADSNMLWQVVAGVAAAAFGSAIFALTQVIAILRIQSTAFVALQTGVWDHLLKLSPAFFRGFTAGQLRVRADSVTRINALLTADALRTLFAAASAFLSVMLMFWYSPALALIALFCGTHDPRPGFFRRAFSVPGPAAVVGNGGVALRTCTAMHQRRLKASRRRCRQPRLLVLGGRICQEAEAQPRITGDERPNTSHQCGDPGRGVGPCLSLPAQPPDRAGAPSSLVTP